MSEVSTKFLPSEALFVFAGWLTSRKEPVTFSAKNDAAIATELVGEFCEANGLEEPRDDHTLWPTHPTGNQPHLKDMTDG